MSLPNKPIVVEIEWEEIKPLLPKQDLAYYGNNLEKFFLGYSRSIAKIQFRNKVLEIKKEGRTIETSSREEILAHLIKAAIRKIAKTYYGKDIKKDNLNVCYSFVRKRFYYLSIPEIQLAFDLTFDGTIEANLFLYGADIAVLHIGQVLQKYSAYREKGIKSIRDAIDLYRTPNENNESIIEIKNRNARLEMIDEISVCYQRFYNGERVKLKGGMKSTLIKLKCQLPQQIINPKKVKPNDERISKIMDRFRAVPDTYDEGLKAFFEKLKGENISPKDFKEDLKKRLENYEQSLSNNNPLL